MGLGIKSDRSPSFAKLGTKLCGVVDLNTVCSMEGYKKKIGVRNAVGLTFNQLFAKSRKVTNSNWSQHELTVQ